MTSRLSRLLHGLLAVGALAAAAAVPLPASADEYAPVARSRAPAEDPDGARVIVKYRSEGTLMRAQSAAAGRGAAVRPQHAAALSQRLGVRLTDGRVIDRHMQAVFARGLTSAELAARLAADPDVEFAVPSLRRYPHNVPNDPYFSAGQTAITPAVGQWYLRAPDAAAPAAIDAAGAWDVTFGSPGITVAVLDTGVRFEHPDLAGKLWPGYDFVSRLGGSNDGNGRDADASDPGDAVAAGECSAGEAAQTSSWHGTEVAGLIGAATNNAIGMAGVGRNVMVLPVRVLGKCGGFDDDIIAGMLWAAGLTIDPVANPHPARVLNLSLGSTGTCTDGRTAAYRSAFAQLAAAGVTVVVSAGNGNGLAVDVPANCAGVIAVGGVRHTGTKVGYSNVGPEVALTAPAGNCVNTSGSCLYALLTTTNAGTSTPGASIYSDGGSRATLGTSFSAPLVAGSAALLLSVNPSLTPAQVKSALQASARPFPTTGAAAGTPVCRAPSAVEQTECYCTMSTCGAGLLDARAAAFAVAGSALPVPVATATAAGAALPSDGVVAGTAVLLDGSASRAAGGAAIVGYQWTVVSGNALVTALTPDPASPAKVTLQTSPTGSGGVVAVALTVTDSNGIRQTASTLITVQAAAGSGGSSASSGGGGGALGAGWLGGVALAVAALAALRRREAGGCIA